MARTKRTIPTKGGMPQRKVLPILSGRKTKPTTAGLCPCKYEDGCIGDGSCPDCVHAKRLRRYFDDKQETHTEEKDQKHVDGNSEENNTPINCDDVVLISGADEPPKRKFSLKRKRRYYSEDEIATLRNANKIVPGKHN